MFNPSEAPFGSKTFTAGVKAGYFTPTHIIGFFSGIQSTRYNYYMGSEHGAIQKLSYLEIPFGAEILAGPYRRTKFYIEPAVSLCFVTAASFDNYSNRPDFYPSGNNKSECAPVVVKPSLGAGFHFSAGAHCAINIGVQVSATVTNTYKPSEYVPEQNSHLTGALQLAFEYHLKDIRRGKDAPPNHYRGPH
ncbi:hypothetical protein DN068_15640 [Taibaiella soli]|uniref:Outer membrane protein beta-barrel domain-containing protein n=2 Tax=Taibaiella soli TaxID=1649169 RepID=A0A2W2AI95_9BACT|nr:hypothetical protein DN068_15640 [Taibaiella soli]